MWWSSASSLLISPPPPLSLVPSPVLFPFLPPPQLIFLSLFYFTHMQAFRFVCTTVRSASSTVTCLRESQEFWTEIRIFKVRNFFPFYFYYYYLLFIFFTVLDTCSIMSCEWSTSSRDVSCRVVSCRDVSCCWTVSCVSYGTCHALFVVRSPFTLTDINSLMHSCRSHRRSGPRSEEGRSGQSVRFPFLARRFELPYWIFSRKNLQIDRIATLGCIVGRRPADTRKGSE